MKAALYPMSYFTMKGSLACHGLLERCVDDFARYGAWQLQVIKDLGSDAPQAHVDDGAGNGLSHHLARSVQRGARGTLCPLRTLGLVGLHDRTPEN